jgi:hypothetical protein
MRANADRTTGNGSTTMTPRGNLGTIPLDIGGTER